MLSPCLSRLSIPTALWLRWYTMGIYVPEYAFIRFAPLAHEFRGLWCDVKIFKPSRLFLFEDDPGIFALLVYLSSC